MRFRFLQGVLTAVAFGGAFEGPGLGGSGGIMGRDNGGRSTVAFTWVEAETISHNPAELMKTITNAVNMTASVFLRFFLRYGIGPPPLKKRAAGFPSESNSERQRESVPSLNCRLRESCGGSASAEKAQNFRASLPKDHPQHRAAIAQKSYGRMWVERAAVIRMDVPVQ